MAAPEEILVGRNADETLVLATPQRLERCADTVAGNAARLEAALPPGVEVVAGMSAVSGVDRERAADQARFCRRLAADGGARVRVIDAAGLTTHAVLIASAPEEMREAFRSGLVAPLRAYDARHRGDLFGTLRAFLEHDCSWRRTAERLHIHVSTLHYRIERVERITGKDLSSLPDRIDLYLALHL